MSADDPNANAPPPCSICSMARVLSEHLIEVGLAANYLGNKSIYTSEHGTATIETETIGNWLQLAAQLENVEVNTWKFESSDAALYCGTWADNIDDHSKHYTKHATALTRFIFVCNALEEAYRFIDHLYSHMATRKGIAKSRLKKTSSLRAVGLLDDLIERVGAATIPQSFEHHCGNFIRLFNRYKAEHGAAVGGIDAGAEKLPTYALQLVRNLRNHVAHGTFPLGPPQDYGGYEDSEELVLMLRHACRVAALYIQIILSRFSTGFESWDYESIRNAHSKKFDRFLEKCTLEYILDLHLKGDFALHQAPYVYDEEDDDNEVVIYRPSSNQA